MAPIFKRVTGFSPEEVQIIVIVNETVSILSLIGTVYVVVHWFMLKSLRRQLSYRLILWVAISDGIYSLSQFLGAPEDPIWCKTQGIIMNFGAISSIFWVDAVSYTIHCLIQSKATELPTESEINQFVLCLHLIIWTASALISCFPLLTDTYGPAGGWCWFKSETVADSCWIIAFYSIVWISIGYTLFVYISIWSKFKSLNSAARPSQSQRKGIRNGTRSGTDSDVEMAVSKSSKSWTGGTRSGYHTQQSSTDQLTTKTSIDEPAIRPRPGAGLRRQDTPKEVKRQRTLRRIALFPMVLVFCFLPGSVRRIIDIAGGDYPYWVAVIQVAMLSLIGLLDAIVYGMTKEAKKKDIELIRKCCPCCIRNGSSDHRVLRPQDSGQ